MASRAAVTVSVALSSPAFSARFYQVDPPTNICSFWENLLQSFKLFTKQCPHDLGALVQNAQPLLNFLFQLEELWVIPVGARDMRRALGTDHTSLFGRNLPELLALSKELC